MPETTYDRSYYVPAAVASAATGSGSSIDGDKPTEERLEEAAPSGQQIPAKRSYLSELAVCRGVIHHEQSFLWLMAQPITMLVSPVVLVSLESLGLVGRDALTSWSWSQFAILTYGLAITLCVVIATGSAQM